MKPWLRDKYRRSDKMSSTARSAPYSTSLIGALGLPRRKPSSVFVTVSVCGGILGDTGSSEVDVGRGEKRSAEEIMEEDRKRREQESRLPLGVYEPQTGIVLCELLQFLVVNKQR